MTHTTADRLTQDMVGKHITLIDPQGSVSGRLTWFESLEPSEDWSFQPVHVNVVIFDQTYTLKVSPHTECEITD